MTTNYPSAVDAFTNPLPTDLESSVVVPHSDQHTNANDAVLAIEQELGIAPKGDDADVKARLDRIETSITNNLVGGTTGAVGLSAYDLAVERGYVGTVTQWLATLGGPTGDVGADGLIGPTGTQGPVGDQGPKGIQGPPSSGSAVTPIVQVTMGPAAAYAATTPHNPSWDQVVTDVDGFWSAADDTRLTVPVGLGGVYAMRASLPTQGGRYNFYRSGASLLVNGAAVSNDAPTKDGYLNQFFDFWYTAALADGDYVQLSVMPAQLSPYWVYYIKDGTALFSMVRLGNI